MSNPYFIYSLRLQYLIFPFLDRNSITLYKIKMYTCYKFKG